MLIAYRAALSLVDKLFENRHKAAVGVYRLLINYFIECRQQLFEDRNEKKTNIEF